MAQDNSKAEPQSGNESTAESAAQDQTDEPIATPAQEKPAADAAEPSFLDEDDTLSELDDDDAGEKTEASEDSHDASLEVEESLLEGNHFPIPTDRPANEDDIDDELGWAIGSELEFVAEHDEWDGPVGDGLDEEEGLGGLTMRESSAPKKAEDRSNNRRE